MSTPAICSAPVPCGQRRDVRGRHDRQGRIKVYGDRMVYVQTDDGAAWEPNRPAQTALGELLLEAMSPRRERRERG